MIRRKIVVISLITIVTLLIFLNPIQGNSYYGVIIANVVNANYADIDMENDVYDIVYDIEVYLDDFLYSDYYYGYDLTLFVGLELPSGLEWWYQIDIISYNYFFSMQMVFFDASTESGWYTAHLYSYSNYYNELTYYSKLIFDPPGAGVGGGSPPLVSITIT